MCFRFLLNIQTHRWNFFPSKLQFRTWLWKQFRWCCYVWKGQFSRVELFDVPWFGAERTRRILFASGGAMAGSDGDVGYFPAIRLGRSHESSSRIDPRDHPTPVTARDWALNFKGPAMRCGNLSSRLSIRCSCLACKPLIIDKSFRHISNPITYGSHSHVVWCWFTGFWVSAKR